MRSSLLAGLVAALSLSSCFLAVSEDRSGLGSGGQGIRWVDLPGSSDASVDSGTPDGARSDAAAVEKGVQAGPDAGAAADAGPSTADAGRSTADASTPPALCAVALHEVTLPDSKRVYSAGVNMEHLAPRPNCPDGADCTLANLETFVDQHAHSYEELLCACAAKYPQIILPVAGQQLTAAEEDTNRRAVVDCGYTMSFTKMYWVTGIVERVDVCGRKFGAAWRLPTQAEVESMTAADVSALKDDYAFGRADPFYHPTRFFVLMAGGAMGLADVSLATNRVIAQSAYQGPTTCNSAWTHCEAGFTVRCVR